MRPILTILSLAALLVVGVSVLAGGDGAASAQEAVTVTMSATTGPDGGGSQTGTTILTAMGNQTEVVVSIDVSPDGSDVEQPAHVHAGTCGDNLGAVVHVLTNVVDGGSTTVIDATLESIRTGDFSINIHKSGAEVGVYVSCGVIPASTDPLDEAYRQFHDTLNAGDVAAALAFFTDDGVFEAAGMTFSGPALQKNFEAQVSQNRQVEIISSEVSGDTLTASIEVRAKQITACGSERVVGAETATFSGDKISRLVFQDDPSDPQTATVLACVQALPATGGEPPVQTARLPLALLLASVLILGGLAAVGGATTMLLGRRAR